MTLIKPSREEFAALDAKGQAQADAILQAAGIADVIHAPL